jgi:hypothetical protein
MIMGSASVPIVLPYAQSRNDGGIARRQPLMAAPQRHRLRRWQTAFGAIGVLLELHAPNLVSAEWLTVPPS